MTTIVRRYKQPDGMNQVRLHISLGEAHTPAALWATASKITGRKDCISGRKHEIPLRKDDIRSGGPMSILYIKIDNSNYASIVQLTTCLDFEVVTSA